MIVSVLMAAYNGEKFIYEQLKSIYNQVRKPDEVIICDDCSTDNTSKVIETFKKKYPTLNIKVYVNDKNLGYAGNFFRAATLSSGDLLFFSDQDDIWLPDKIAKMTQGFEDNDNIGGLICDFELINEKSENIGKKKREKKDIQIKQVSFEKMIYSFNCGGLNFAVRREYIEKYREFIIKNKLSHDVPLGIIISSQNKLYKINKVYVKHRVHANNVTKPEYTVFARLGNVKKQIKAAHNKLYWLEKCKEVVIDKISDEDKNNYIKTITYYKQTEDALENRKIKVLVKLCFENNPMVNKKIALFNVITVLFSNKES